MQLSAKRGVVDNLSIEERRGGKFISNTASFNLQGSDINFNFKDMPDCSLSYGDDTLLEGDDLFIVFQERKELDGITRIVAFKNLRSGECLHADVGILIFLAAFLPIIFIPIFFQIHNGNMPLRVAGTLYLIVFAIAAGMSLPMALVARTRRRAKALVENYEPVRASIAENRTAARSQ